MCYTVLVSKNNIMFALLAQLDRVFGYEPKGRGFESLPAYHVRASFISLALSFYKKSEFAPLLLLFTKKQAFSFVFREPYVRRLFAQIVW